MAASKSYSGKMLPDIKQHGITTIHTASVCGTRLHQKLVTALMAVLHYYLTAEI